MFLFQAWPRVIHALARHGRARHRDAGDGRSKIAGAFLLQVTPDLPNPAEYEADRHATEISRTITSNQVTACSFRVLATRLPVQKLPDRF